MASVEKPGAGEKGGKIGCGWKGRENTEQLCQNGRESWETRRRLQVANSSIKKIKQWETCSKICYDAKAKCSSMYNLKEEFIRICIALEKSESGKREAV